MGLAIALRVDFDGATLRRLARKTKNANQSRRMLVLAEIYDGSMSSLRRGLATMLKTPKRWRRLKRGLCSRTEKSPCTPPARHCNRSLVPGRGAHRSEK